MMKNSTQNFFIVLIVIVVVLAVGAFALRFENSGRKDGFEEGRASILEDWSGSDFIDYAIKRDGLYEVLSYINDKEKDSVLEYVWDCYGIEGIAEHYNLYY